MNAPILDNYFGDNPVLASDLVRVLADLIAQHGDLPVSIGIQADYREVLRFGNIDVLDA